MNGYHLLGIAALYVVVSLWWFFERGEECEKKNENEKP